MHSGSRPRAHDECRRTRPRAYSRAVSSNDALQDAPTAGTDEPARPGRSFASRADLLQNLAQELATPLTPLLGYLKMLRDGRLGELTPRQRQALDAMNVSVDRLRHSVDELTDFAAFEAGRISLELSPLDLVELVRSVVRAADDHARSRHVRIELLLPSGLEVSGDGAKLTQALASVLHNAVRFSPHGGHVLVAVSELPRQRVVLEVLDQGPGMPQESSGPSIGKGTAGTGLGLAVARRIAGAHGGELFIESPPKEQPDARHLFCGTRVRLVWPRA